MCVCVCVCVCVCIFSQTIYKFIVFQKGVVAVLVLFVVSDVRAPSVQKAHLFPPDLYLEKSEVRVRAPDPVPLDVSSEETKVPRTAAYSFPRGASHWNIKFLQRAADPLAPDPLPLKTRSLEKTEGQAHAPYFFPLVKAHSMKIPPRAADPVALDLRHWWGKYRARSSGPVALDPPPSMTKSRPLAADPVALDASPAKTKFRARAADPSPRHIIHGLVEK